MARLRGNGRRRSYERCEGPRRQALADETPFRRSILLQICQRPGAGAAETCRYGRGDSAGSQSAGNALGTTPGLR